jgi:5-methylthioribose kinase
MRLPSEQLQSVQVVFTEPFYGADNNRHTSPELDAVVAALQSDAEAKAAALTAKAAFCTRKEALLHGDLHTGSVMVTAESFFVIDSEFAFYGPLAFDVGKFLANLLLTFFALDGHSTPAAPRADQRGAVLQVRRRACMHSMHARRV